MSTSVVVDRPVTDGRSKARVHTDVKIAEAVVQIVSTQGPAAVTMEAVSAISGVARTTLYRRYKDRFELLVAFAEQIVPMPELSGEFTRQGFTKLIRSFQETFESKVGLRLLAHMMASGDEFLSVWRERVIMPRLRLVSRFFERGIEAGQLRADRDPARIIELIAGAVVFTVVIRGGFPRGWAEELAETLWPTIAAG